MRTSSWHLILLSAAAVVSLSVWSSRVSSEEETSTSRSRSSRSAAARADKASEAKLEKKLKQIIETQQVILQKFEAVKEELRIIKVRATN